MSWVFVLMTLWSAFGSVWRSTEKPPEFMMARVCGEAFPLEAAPARTKGIVRGGRVRWREFPVSVFFSSRVVVTGNDERRLRVWAWSDTPISKPVRARVALPKGWIADGQLEVELLFNAPGYVYELPLRSVGAGWPVVLPINRAGVTCS